MLTPDQAFNAGFMLRCAEEGLSPEATQARVDAAEAFSKQAGGPDWLSALLSAPMTGLGVAAGGGTLAGLGIGAGLGMLAQDAGDPLKMKRPPQLEAIQRAELIAAYRQSAEQARRAALVNQRRQQRLANVPRSPYGI